MSEEVKQEGDFKIKKKPGRPKKLGKKDEPVKLDLSKKEEEVKPVENVKVEAEVKPEKKEVIKEEVKPVENKIESPITEVEKTEVKNDIKEEIKKVEETKPIEPDSKLPENIERLVEFMDDTGGTLEDYVRISADYSQVDNDTLLQEYYKHTKPHLDQNEIAFVMEDNFMFDEDVDEERDIRKKKLAYKEEIAKAKGFLDGLKDKYYAEIKKRPGITQDQQKATDFFNRYNEDLAKQKQAQEDFISKTNNFFNKEFKGFEFDVGEKRFNYKVNDIDSTINQQKDADNFFRNHIGEDGNLNLNTYHKALYAARNADAIANHFYEQGKSDATKDIMSKSKNINNDPRKVSSGEVFVNGWKVKAISGIDSSKLKIKKK